MKISKKAILFSITLAFFVVLDRFIKAICLKGLLDKPFPIVSDILSLHFVKNYYISFSLPFSGPILTTITGLIILILLIILIKSLKNQELKEQNNNFNYSLTILLIGAIINFTDRLKFGYVIDYFDLKWFTVFNIADIMIVIGILLIILNYYGKNGTKHEN